MMRSGGDETVGDTGFCTQCLDTLEIEVQEPDENTEMDLVEMLEQKGIC